MNAIILAAGVGRRLGNSHQGPKCLLEIGGRTLLSRHLVALRQLGIQRVVICVGYESGQIRTELANLGVLDFCSTVDNPQYERGSVVSLWTVRDHLCDDDGVLLMDADVLYDQAILARLVQTEKPNCFLLDREFEAGDEPVKLCVRDQQIVEFRKLLASDLAYDYCGESVGFFRFSTAMGARLANRCEYYLDQALLDEHYEEAIRDLLLESPHEFSFEDVSGRNWIEIDFPEDVKRANDEILPAIND